MNNILNDYFEALQRLKKRQSLRVAKGSKINNDSVALEAGRGKGSIKKSRIVFSELISAINDAALAQDSMPENSKDKIAKLKRSSEKYRKLYEDALARELSLVHQIFLLHKELEKYKS